MTPTSFWLMKTEPTAYSIDDLKKDKVTFWNGVRNYQARNFMRDSMNVGDLVLFYHSNAEPPGIAGIARIKKTGYPDHSAFDPRDKHYDPKSSVEKPLWYMVDVEFVEKFKKFVALDKIKNEPALSKMLVVKRGMRLSVQPVTSQEFNVIKKMGD